MRTNLSQKEITIEVTDAVLDHLADKGWDPVFGARPLRRTIQTVIEDSLSDALLGGDYGEGDAVHLDYIRYVLDLEASPRVDPVSRHPAV